MKRLLMIGVLLIIIGGVYSMLSSSTAFSGNPSDLISKAKRYDCSVTVSNPVLFDSKISAASCTNTGYCYLGSNLLSMAAYSWFGVVDELQLKATVADGWSASDAFSITESKDSVRNFKPCTNSNSLQLNLYQEGNKIGSQTVALS